MHILVTGGCGFIGSNFIRLALNSRPGWKIRNLDKLTYAGNPASTRDIEEKYSQEQRYAFTIGDIADAALVEELFQANKFDAVINFAAETHVDRSVLSAMPFVHSNVAGTQVLLDAARAQGIKRFVHVSTDEVYGDLGPDDPPFTETTPLKPSSPYSASKAAADLLALAAHKTHGLDLVITRCSNNYGPYQFPEKLIPLMIMKASRGEHLPVYGDGSNVRDWIHVEDHCRGVMLAIEKGRPGAVYNFGGQGECGNLYVVRLILEMLGKPESLIHFVKDRPAHDRRYAMDFSLATRELGYAPTRDFKAGLKDTVNWYLANTSWVQAVESGEYRTFIDAWYGGRL